MIDLHEVSFSYGSHQVLAGVGGRLGPGTVGLVGLNGAGKTTLLRLLALINRPDGGRIAIDGEDVGDRSGRRRLRSRLGYLPQAAGWSPRFTVRELCHYFAWMHGVPREPRQELVEAALVDVDLSGLADHRLGSLSGGQHRRAMIAQAIAHGPDVLILDEPTAGLDPQQRMGFRSLVTELGRKRTVVLSTHLVEDVALAATQVVILHRGRFAFNGTVADLTALATGDDDMQSPMEQAFARVVAEQAAR